jgi:2-beta-glucuronyltransferase
MTQTGSVKAVVIVSAVHDYRMGRRGSIQAIADALVRLGYQVSFISIRYSLLSLIKGDPRNFLWRRANRLEVFKEVRCYLWRTLIHPFHSKSDPLNAIIGPLYSLYARLPNRFIDDAFASASFVIIESGLGIMLTRRARALNPVAKIIYRASDKLDTIGAHPVLQRELEGCRAIINYFCLLADKMASDFAWAQDKLYAVKLGVHADDFSHIGPNPYVTPINAISVGSMLFDPAFFVHAAKRFPEVVFHIIGCGMQFEAPENVHIYPEMPFKATLPFIKYATFGVAAYRASPHAEYLSQSSLKLMQYEYLQIPAVCPDFAVGGNINRFGYAARDPRTIVPAVDAAIKWAGHVVSRQFQTWDNIAQRLLDPGAFSDTQIPIAATAESLEAEASATESHLAVPPQPGTSVPPSIGSPTVSLVVCSLGRIEELDRLFASLLAQSCRDFEIILVDQNPDGFLKSIVDKFHERFALQHVRSETGLSRARNIGLRHSRGQLICFPDDDCWYPPSVIKDVIAFFAENPTLDLLLGKTVDQEGRDSLSAFRRGSGPISKWNIWSSGNSNTLFVRHAAASRIGGFDVALGVGADTPFQSGEETDFVLKALELKMRATFVSGLHIYHEQVDTVIGDRQLKRARSYSLGFGRVLKKHRFGLLYLLYRTVRSAGRTLISLVTLDVKQARYKSLWIIGTVKGYFS